MGHRERVGSSRDWERAPGTGMGKGEGALGTGRGQWEGTTLMGRGHREWGGDPGGLTFVPPQPPPQGAYAIVELREAASRERALAQPQHALAGRSLRVRPREQKDFARPSPGRGAHREPLGAGQLERALCQANDVSWRLGIPRGRSPGGIRGQGGPVGCFGVRGAGNEASPHRWTRRWSSWWGCWS